MGQNLADALFNLNTKISETYRKKIMSAIGVEICPFYGRKKVHKVMTIHVRSKKKCYNKQVTFETKICMHNLVGNNGASS